MDPFEPDGRDVGDVLARLGRVARARRRQELGEARGRGDRAMQHPLRRGAPHRRVQRVQDDLAVREEHLLVLPDVLPSMAIRSADSAT